MKEKRKSRKVLKLPSPARDLKQTVTDQILHSYTRLTVNADDHDFMMACHKTYDEKRMVVILPKGSYADWLTGWAGAERSIHERLPCRSSDRGHVMGFT